jgi:hypothetical protein
MTTTTILVTAIAFLAGVAIGWRHIKLGGLFLLFGLILVFVVFDYAVDSIVVWPYKYWVIVDLIAVQIGYLVGAVLGMVASARKDRNRREPD